MVELIKKQCETHEWEVQDDGYFLCLQCGIKSEPEPVRLCIDFITKQKMQEYIKMLKTHSLIEIDTATRKLKNQDYIHQDDQYVLRRPNPSEN